MDARFKSGDGTENNATVVFDLGDDAHGQDRFVFDDENTASGQV